MELSRFGWRVSVFARFFASTVGFSSWPSSARSPPPLPNRHLPPFLCHETVSFYLTSLTHTFLDHQHTSSPRHQPSDRRRLACPPPKQAGLGNDWGWGFSGDDTQNGQSDNLSSDESEKYGYAAGSGSNAAKSSGSGKWQQASSTSDKARKRGGNITRKIDPNKVRRIRLHGVLGRG